jgi:hypothetical protein
MGSDLVALKLLLFFLPAFARLLNGSIQTECKIPCRLDKIAASAETDTGPLAYPTRVHRTLLTAFRESYPTSCRFAYGNIIITFMIYYAS